MNITQQIYELISSNPKEAISFADVKLLTTKDQNLIDQINWAKAYALVDLKEFSKAKSIWEDIYDRTKNHKALHQIGFVLREQNEFLRALEIYTSEQILISNSDTLSIAVNLYELSYCNLLLNNIEKSLEYFHQYSKITFNEIDPIERACFYRLKGDIYSFIDKIIAKDAYLTSLTFFKEAKDEIGENEIAIRIQNIE